MPEQGYLTWCLSSTQSILSHIVQFIDTREFAQFIDTINVFIAVLWHKCYGVCQVKFWWPNTGIYMAFWQFLDHWCVLVFNKVLELLTLYSQYPIIVDTILNIRPEWWTPVGYTVPCENSAHFGRFSSYHVDSISFGYEMMIQYRRAAARVRCDQLRWFVIVDISGRNFRRFSLGKRGHVTTTRKRGLASGKMAPAAFPGRRLDYTTRRTCLSHDCDSSNKVRRRIDTKVH